MNADIKALLGLQEVDREIIRLGEEVAGYPGLRQARTTEITRLREQALQGMRSFADFRPRLVGSVLDGLADARQPVRLLLFADRAEDVVFALMARDIPWQQQERTLRFADGARRTCPVLRFFAGETGFELVVLPLSALSNTRACIKLRVWALPDRTRSRHRCRS